MIAARRRRTSAFIPAKAGRITIIATPAAIPRPGWIAQRPAVIRMNAPPPARQETMNLSRYFIARRPAGLPAVPRAAGLPPLGGVVEGSGIVLVLVHGMSHFRPRAPSRLANGRNIARMMNPMIPVRSVRSKGVRTAGITPTLACACS